MLNLLKKVTIALEQEKIEYMVSGSLALIIYTIPRMTRDIEISVDSRLSKRTPNGGYPGVVEK